MATYKINVENTGLDTYAQVEKMAELMQADGHDVAATSDSGFIQNYDSETDERVECPVNDATFFGYVERAATEQ